MSLLFLFRPCLVFYNPLLLLFIIILEQNLHFLMIYGVEASYFSIVTLLFSIHLYAYIIINQNSPLYSVLSRNISLSSFVDFFCPNSCIISHDAS